MLVDINDVAHAVRFAQHIARKMSKDPEVDSIAGEAAWRALYTYKIERGVKLSWWIAQLTKQAVQYYWRRIAKLREREKFMDELWWAEQSEAGRVSDGTRYPEDNQVLRNPDNDVEIEVNANDWQLLVESFILRWPIDVIARERGVSVGAIRKQRTAAISRLEAVC